MLSCAPSPLLQGFINNSFANISSTEHALSLLQQFRAIMQRPSLQRELATKWLVIFQHYARDLEQVQALYEKHKASPPVPRNAPPVAGAHCCPQHAAPSRCLLLPCSGHAAAVPTALH